MEGVFTVFYIHLIYTLFYVCGWTSYSYSPSSYSGETDGATVVGDDVVVGRWVGAVVSATVGTHPSFLFHVHHIGQAWNV